MKQNYLQNPWKEYDMKDMTKEIKMATARHKKLQ